ncbi:hypothetical protein SAVCW2_18240 [Streptomyces avermitilis]|uniref:Uncharacterized protein n=1 Tax=Streptomyces avermitilis TaxID=33903 RepID=A0A4D4MN48_STRAX|nr:hypothetical protein SAV31267_030180 [Streptomyces avermitilis]GDY82625.1 hypothetical protein SAVCW2_18240 [Streptomyces avermitilis]
MAGGSGHGRHSEVNTRGNERNPHPRVGSSSAYLGPGPGRPRTPLRARQTPFGRRALGSVVGPVDPIRSATETQWKRDFTTVTALTLSTAAASGLRADAIVVGVAKSPKGDKGLVVAPGAEAVDKGYDGKLAAVLETLGASGPRAR